MAVVGILYVSKDYAKERSYENEKAAFPNKLSVNQIVKSIQIKKPDEARPTLAKEGKQQLERNPRTLSYASG